MEPRIQYAKTGDGVNIAYWTLGSGPALVLPPNLFASHVQVEWGVEGRRVAYERLAERATVIRYDCRGLGMSDREPADFSTAAATMDLEAVVNRLGLEKFALFSQLSVGQFVFPYAATHPERVSHVIYRVSYNPTGFEDAMRRFELIRPIARDDWMMYTEVAARIIAGWNHSVAPALAELIRASHPASSAQLVEDALRARFTPEVVPSISAPLLILHTLGDESEASEARRVASVMGHAQVLGIPGMIGGAYGDAATSNAMLDFISSPGGDQPVVVDTTALRTVLFTDIVGHTEMMSRLGDERGREVLQEHERITREVLKAHGGTEVKTMGDGFMASFGSVTKAVECAVALQRNMEQGTWSMGERIQVRCGLNAGEPIEEEGPDGRADLFGATVILASRIAARAEGGEILVADTVRGLCSGKGFLFADRGEFTAKGFEEAVRVYEVRWREGS